MDGGTVRNYFRDPATVQHYVEAATRLGLWASEETVLTQLFDRAETLLECGCGAGRIAFGLWELGYRHLLGFDFSREMIVEARRMARILEYGISFRVADATRLDFENESFDGAIFGFNGLMQIPLRANRREALIRISSAIRPGGYFVFTTHDRDLNSYRAFWEKKVASGRRATSRRPCSNSATVIFRLPTARSSFTFQARTKCARISMRRVSTSLKPTCALTLRPNRRRSGNSPKSADSGSCGSCEWEVPLKTGRQGNVIR